MKTAEREVIKAEESLALIEKELSQSSLYQNSDKANEAIRQHSEIQQTVERAYAKWQSAEEELSAFAKNIDGS